jgi:hypothetical protein
MDLKLSGTTAEGAEQLFRQVPEVDILVNNLGIVWSII